jgi:membrane-bound serine protease (ClpP class)
METGLVTAMSPDGAVLLLTAGVGLIYYELNRPGTIVAGAVGLLGVLFSVAVLVERGLTPLSVGLILAGTLLLAVDLVRPMPVATAILATTALVFGLWKLPAHLPVAAGCGVLLGAGTPVLTRIARRARTNKGLD